MVEMARRALQSIRRRRLRRIVCRLHGDQQGQMYLLAAILVVPVFLGFVMMVTQVGQMLEVRRHLQTAADAAALAGAWELPDSPPSAQAVAGEYAGINGEALAGLPSVTSTYTNSDTITVTTTRTISLSLLPLAQTVVATATAIVGSLSEYRCLMPLGVEDSTGTLGDGVDYVIGEEYVLKINPQDWESGNSHALAIYGNGFNNFVDGMKGDECLNDPLGVGDDVYTQTGAGPIPQINNALNYRIVDSGHGGHTFEDVVDVQTVGGVTTYTLIEPECPRLAILAIVGGTFDLNGHKAVSIIGFALFFIQSWAQQGGEFEITGIFIDPMISGTFGGYTGFGPRVVRLIR